MVKGRSHHGGNPKPCNVVNYDPLSQGLIPKAPGCCIPRPSLQVRVSGFRVHVCVEKAKSSTVIPELSISQAERSLSFV